MHTTNQHRVMKTSLNVKITCSRPTRSFVINFGGTCPGLFSNGVWFMGWKWKVWMFVDLVTTRICHGNWWIPFRVVCWMETISRAVTLDFLWRGYEMGVTWQVVGRDWRGDWTDQRHAARLQVFWVKLDSPGAKKIVHNTKWRYWQDIDWYWVIYLASL